MTRRRSNALRNQPLIAGLLLGVFLFVLAAAHSWALHHAVCAEASAPSHKCAVTLLTGGQVQIAPGAVSVVKSPPVMVVCVQAAPVALTVADYFLLPSRGPPASLA
ncbi:MAG: hypothetical protein KJ070_16190 [Verrucomicrobia bacterium]|nr:hypothetical protein [Verrucomicrobiota bacterium]